jgi:hypothetical protein
MNYNQHNILLGIRKECTYFQSNTINLRLRARTFIIVDWQQDSDFERDYDFWCRRKFHGILTLCSVSIVIPLLGYIIFLRKRRLHVQG